MDALSAASLPGFSQPCAVRVLSLFLHVMMAFVQKFVADALEHYRMQAVTLTGERVGLMTEVITCMKLIKMNAWEWEPFFVARISSRCFRGFVVVVWVREGVGGGGD